MPKEKIRTEMFLANIPLFSEFEPGELEKIALHTTEVHVKRGDLIVRRGDPCVGFHIVAYGRVKLYITSAQGAEKVVEIIGQGHSFGEALMFMDKPYIVSAQALEDCMLLHVAKTAVLEGVERQPGFAFKMLSGLSRRLHGLMSDVEAYSLNSGTQRVIDYLLKEVREDQRQVVLPTSKTVVASRLNLTPEHFSRILHDLSEHRLINMNGRVIEIPDPHKLRTYQV